jgi:divalent metal cation (Fe/Co/Zn/Cd) transporter
MAPQPGSSWQTALNLEYFTVAYNILEAVASIVFGTAALSIALVGFGLDSIVESLSGLVLIWRLRKHENLSREEEMRTERHAEQFVSATFFILGIYILYESVNKLAINEPAQPSAMGIVIAVLSLIIMPILAWKKRVIGTAIGSRALLADAKETIVCAFLSAALLAGLLANYLFGFWQADPLVGIVIVLFLFHEGYETWCGSCGGCACTNGD